MKYHDLAKIFKEGDLDFIAEYANHSEENLHNALTKGFEDCISSGKVESVRFLLTSDKIPRHADIHHKDGYALNIACHYGHLPLVKYLLTSSDLSEHSDINAKDGTPLRYAANANHLHVIRYFIEELKAFIDINHHCGITGKNAFMSACDQNSIESAKYLASLEDFNIEKSLYTFDKDKKDGFMLACENHEKDTELVDFIVFDLGFKPQEAHLQYFLQNPNDEEIMYAKKTIGIRDLEEKLSSQLYNKTKEKILKL